MLVKGLQGANHGIMNSAYGEFYALTNITMLIPVAPFTNMV